MITFGPGKLFQLRTVGGKTTNVLPMQRVVRRHRGRKFCYKPWKFIGNCGPLTFDNATNNA